MFFYFLGFVLALVTIFGLVHTRTVSERLHLQNFCVWSSSTVRRQLQEYNLFGFHRHPDVDILEINVTPVETSEPRSDETSLETIEEIRDIKLIAEGENSSTTEEPTEAVPTSSTINPTEARPSESRDSVLSAINASLRRLSSVATSGRINGAQLYQILLRETLLHDKTVSKPTTTEDVDQLSSASSSNTVTFEAVTEDENTNGENKEKLYFGGDTPLEYVPHQK